MTPSSPTLSYNWIESTDSTNIELRRRLESSDNLSFLATSAQTAGRGQGDHTWYSTPGKNLTFSFLLRFSEQDGTYLEARDILLITCITTLAIRDYLASKGVAAGIKWPNDIWVDGRKICGILIENIVEDGAVTASIVGVGLNLNESDWPEELPNPVSLHEITGLDYDPVEELQTLSKDICRRYWQMASAGGRILLQEEFGKIVFRLPEVQQP